MKRMTAQRRAILNVLETGGRPLSPEEILEQARTQAGTIRGIRTRG